MEKGRLMEENYRKIIESVGEDVDREGLKDTPKRAAKAMEFLTKGYKEDIDKIVNGAVFKTDSEGMIVLRNIELYSMCEHHLLPFFGKCHVGYIPNGKVIGVSKIARIVEVFARRFQVQENLTKQIGDAVMKYTGAKGVGVVIEAQHLCMMMRGVEKQNSVMETSYMLGTFLSHPESRSEFLNLLKK